MNHIDPIFDWLLTASLRASVLAVAILSIGLVLRRRLPAGWRHALWLPMLVVLVLPVLPVVPFGLFPPAEKFPTAVANTAIPIVGEDVENAMQPTAPAALKDTPNPLAIVWFVGACGVLVAGVVGYRKNMIRVRTHSVVPDSALLSSVGAAAREAGLSHVPRVLVSTAVESPAVTGLIRPVLLLPAGFPEGFSATETRLILLHEFSHLKRLDLPLNWVSCVLQAMHWFNPVLWFAFARMRADREAACDARVLSIDSEDRRADYGSALLKLQCMAPSRSLTLGFVGIFERGSEMKSRIHEISTHRPGHVAWQVASGAILTLLMMFGATKAQEADPADGTAGNAAPADAPLTSGERVAYIVKKLQGILIPAVDFENASIDEVVGFLSLRAKELDVTEPDPAKKGVNFVIRKPRANGKAGAAFGSITLSLKNASLQQAINSVADQIHIVYTVDDFAVTFHNKEDDRPVGEGDSEKAFALPKAEEGKAAEASNKIIIPMVVFENATLKEAVDLLNLRANGLSKGEPGFKLVIDPAVDASAMIRELRLRNVPVSIAAKYCADQAKLSLSSDDKEIRFQKP